MDTSVDFSICPNHGCGRVLTEGPNGESLWCDECCQPFESEEVKTTSLWRKMSLAERAAQIKRYGTEVIDQFKITQSQYQDAVNTLESRKAARALFVGDVSPEKATLPNLARGISDAGALREMIDNATDSAQKKGLRRPVTVSVRINADDGTVIVRDDAGGMNREDLLRCLRLGASQKEHDENVIGRFGVGAKEAIYHFGREVIIRTREIGSSEGLRLEVPESWLDTKNWTVEIQAVDDVKEGSTEIRIGSLVKFDYSIQDAIIPELWKTYRKKIERGLLSIVVNDTAVDGAVDPELLYPPEIYPRAYKFETMDVAIDLNVCTLRDAPEESGIFFYAFGRLYCHWFWNDPKTKMIFEKVPQHKLSTHFRVDIDFSGRVDDVPINANKDEVETGSPVFSAMGKVVKRLCDPYLGTVNFLSHGGMKDYVDQFHGPEKAHRLAKVGEPAFTIGKWFEGKQVEKSWRADADTFKSVILADIEAEKERMRPEVEGGLEPEEAQAHGTSAQPTWDGPATGENGKTSAELFEPPKPSIPIVRLKLDAPGLDGVIFRRLQRELKKVGERLNVQLELFQ